MIYYVVLEDEDCCHACARRFDSKAAAKKYLHTEQYDFSTRELFTEDEFMAQWTKPENYFTDEESAEDEGYYWDDDLQRWTCADIRDN